MSKDYFRNTIRALEELSRTTTYTMKILPDQDGYIDKEFSKILKEYYVYGGIYE